MQLGTPGEYDGKTIISTTQMNEIRKPQVIRGQADAMAPQATYGLGWTITDYKGKRVLTHGGATDVFNTAMYIVSVIDIGFDEDDNIYTVYGNIQRNTLDVVA